jgi:hypothetical protein
MTTASWPCGGRSSFAWVHCQRAKCLSADGTVNRAGLTRLVKGMIVSNAEEGVARSRGCGDVERH